MSSLYLALLSSFAISLGSLLGVFTIFTKSNSISKFLLTLVSLSAGTMMGAAFLHLLPEAVEAIAPTTAFTITLISFVSFLIIEKILHWRHCHKGFCDIHTFGVMNLIGDSVHNFIDGLIIASTFIVSPQLGLVTTLAIALHEIPQEISDFGVLLYSGYSKQKALFMNFGVALTSILGVVFGYFLIGTSSQALPYLVSVAAGGFLYIAASDLVPEIRMEENLGKSLSSILFFILGLIFMYFTSSI